MVSILLAAYFGGWIVTTLVVFSARRWLSDRRAPAPHPLLVSVFAGAVWPLLLVGLVELSSVVVYTKVQSKPDQGIGVLV